MTTEISDAGALAGLRVLEIANPTSAYCGKLLADMGADVILLEPVHGSALRQWPPFIGGKSDPEFSIPFTYYNTSKRSITLNLDHPDGQRLFLRLAKDADVVIEAERVGTMARRGLDTKILWAIEPRLVVTSITPFGQTGPYAAFEGEDLVSLAMGGFLYISGYPDLPPTRIYGDQAFLAASMYAAVATLIAVLGVEESGHGEHIDVSIQESVTMALENTAQFYDLEGRVRKRSGLTQRYTGAGLFPCRDGYVYVFVGGLAAIRFWEAFVEWMVQSGAVGADRLRGPQWFDRSFRESDEARSIFAEVFGQFALSRDKMELYYAAQSRRIPLSPVSTAADVAQNRQLLARGFITEVPHPASGRPIRMPGAPYRLSATPWRIRRPAPRLGEHNSEVYAALGLATAERTALERARVI